MSDEEQDTIYEALELLQEVWPSKSFYGRKRPVIFVTDDSAAERNVLQMKWPDAHHLLCAFHFLQRNWTWLHDGSNGVCNDN